MSRDRDPTPLAHLARLAVVLVEPQDDINIGNTTRACKNFGVADLRLVRPATGDPDTIRISAPKADDLIAATSRHDTLDDALADRHLVVATTARVRRDDYRTAHPRQTAARVAAELAAGRQVAVLFGREDSGLPNEALDRAHLVVTIPTNPDYSSLNLGQAVLLNLWEIFRAVHDDLLPDQPPAVAASPTEDPASIAAIDRMLDQAERSLHAIEFFKFPDTRHIMKTLRQVFLRARLDPREVKIFHGIFKEVEAYLARTGRG